MSSQTPRSANDVGFCCLKLDKKIEPEPRCPSTNGGMIPYDIIVYALFRQHSASPVPLFTVAGTPHNLSNFYSKIGWFMHFTTNDSKPEYFSLSEVNDSVIKVINLDSPFEGTGVQWRKVKNMRYVWECKDTGKVIEAQVWADPALLEAKVLSGSPATYLETGQGCFSVDGAVMSLPVECSCDRSSHRH